MVVVVVEVVAVALLRVELLLEVPTQGRPLSPRRRRRRRSLRSPRRTWDSLSLTENRNTRDVCLEEFKGAVLYMAGG